MTSSRAPAGQLADVSTNVGARSSSGPSAVVPHRDAPVRRPVLVVLGMHRSGTSLLSHVLQNLGVDMADETDHVSPKNPGGFWERPELVAIHDRILEAIGRPVGSPLHSLPFPAAWWRGKAVQAIKKDLRRYLDQQLEQTDGLWGFKDPRTCRLLPLWSEVFEEVGVAPRYVWAIRAPGEVARSMAAKNPTARPMTASHAEVTWLVYNYDILRYASGASIISIDYEQWFEHSVELAHQLINTLGLPGLPSDADLEDCLREVVRSEYRNEFEHDPATTATVPLAQKLFRDIKQQVPGQPLEGRLKSYVPMLDAIFRTMKPFGELVAEMPELRREVQELRRLATEAAALRTEHDQVKSALADAGKKAAEANNREKELREKNVLLQDEAKRLADKHHAERLKWETQAAEAKRLADKHDAEQLKWQAQAAEVGVLRAQLKANEQQLADLRSAADGYVARLQDLKAALADAHQRPSAPLAFVSAGGA